MVIIRKKRQETAEEKEAREQKEREVAMGAQDQYQARGFELVSWVQDHKIFISSLIALVVIGGALFSAFLYYQTRSSEIASAAYIEAMNMMEEVSADGEERQEGLRQVRAKLEEIATSHQGSNIAALSNLHAASIALDQSDAQSAVALYQQAVSHMGESDRLYPLALIGLAFSQEQAGDVSAALATFESAIDLPGEAGKDLALWEAARLAKESNDTEKAQAYAARLLENYPNSIYERNAKRIKETI